MADVRSMLRQERAARQQPSKPQTRPKSQAPGPAPIGRKRKATEDEHDDRKRARAAEAAGLPSGFFDGGAELGEDDGSAEAIPIKANDDEAANAPTQKQPPAATSHSTVSINEDEWEAFERDVAAEAPALQPVASSIDALAAMSAAPTISAAPLTAEQLAAQAREEQSQQRGQREAELEADKEDAARHLEEEFDEMEELEQRVRRLREKREALRVAKSNGTGVVPVSAQAQQTVAFPSKSDHLENDIVDDSDDDFDEDDWDGWRLNRR